MRSCHSIFLLQHCLVTFRLHVTKWCRISWSAIHRITEWLKLKGTSGDHMVHAHAQSGSPTGCCPVACRWFWSISKAGDSTVYLGNFCQCSVTLIVNKCFLIFRGNLPYFSLLPLVLSLGTTKKAHLCRLGNLPPGIYIH